MIMIMIMTFSFSALCGASCAVLSPSSRRRAFTIVELLVTMAVIGLLIALLLPAVQMARESARRTQCRSNLRQIGIAIANYESQYTMWPPGTSLGLSWHVSILDQMDQRTLSQQVDYTRFPDHMVDDVQGVTLSTYLCPSDPAPASFQGTMGPRIAATSYLGNSGTGVLKDGLNGMFRHIPPWRPDVYEDGPVRAADVTDGMSNTAAVGEVLHGLGFLPSRLRTVWNLPNAYDKSTYETFRRDCRDLPPDPTAVGYVGSGIAHGWQWVQGSIGYSTYTHSLPPMNPSCFNQSHVPTGIYTAGSEHSGLVQILFADGHVSSIANGIDGNTWEQLGSRNGSVNP